MTSNPTKVTTSKQKNNELPPIAPATATKTATTSNDVNANGLESQISPPGMKLRSGRKKKPTPLKRKRDELAGDGGLSDYNDDGDDKDNYDNYDNNTDVDDDNARDSYNLETGANDGATGSSIDMAESRDNLDNHNHDDQNNNNNNKHTKKRKSSSQKKQPNKRKKLLSTTTTSDKHSNDHSTEDDTKNNKNDIDCDTFMKEDDTVMTPTTAMSSFNSPPHIHPTTTASKTFQPIISTTAATSTTASVATADQPQGPSITNLNLKLNSNPAIIDNVPSGGNTRIRNFFTPAPSKTKYSSTITSTANEEECNHHDDLVDTILSTNTNHTATNHTTSPLALRYNNTNNNSTNNSSNNAEDSELEKTTFTTATTKPTTSTTQQQQQLYKEENGGRENGLLHYFKRTTTITPIPVQFSNDKKVKNVIHNNDTNHIVMPKPIRTKNGVHLDSVAGGFGVGTIKTIEQQQQQQQSHHHGEEEDVDDVDEDQNDILSSSSFYNNTPAFYKVHVWFLLIYSFLIIFSGSGSSGKSWMNSIFMVVPNVAKYQYHHWYNFESVVVEEVGTQQQVPEVEQQISDVFQEEIQEEEEEIVQEIIYIDNEKLEERERYLLTQRQIIQKFKKEEEDNDDDNEDKIFELWMEIEEELQLLSDEGDGKVDKLNNILISIQLTRQSGIGELNQLEDLFSKSEGYIQDFKNLESNDDHDSTDIVYKVVNAMQSLRKSVILAIPFDELNMFTYGSSLHVPGDGCTGARYTVLSSEERSQEAKKIEKKKDKEKAKMKVVPMANEKEIFEAGRALLDFIEKYARGVSDSAQFNEVAISWFKKNVYSEISSYESRFPIVDNLSIGPITDLWVRDDGDATKRGASVKEIQHIIDEMIEIELADDTGVYDFASIGNGARVIRSGPRQTSRSIVENLPLFNRFLAKVSLRFYGHRAEAALLPTYPKGALGQCWSFEKEGSRKQVTTVDVEEQEALEMERDRGEYATLSVSLPRPIHVKNIMIEHPLKSQSPTSAASAIKEFRVIGFTDKEARGDPWLLGSFTYDISTEEEESLQIFEIKSDDESELPIPKLSSITLAIDSNWGGNYSCLYRFRVEGR